MSADLWIGIAVGSVTPWVLVILLVRRNKHDVDKAITGGKTATELLAERNKIGRLQVSALMEIQHRLEGIFDRMPKEETEIQRFEILKVYKKTPEAAELLECRFSKSGMKRVFEFKGHNWRYSHTGFDDNGEFDLLERPKVEEQKS